MKAFISGVEDSSFTFTVPFQGSVSSGSLGSQYTSFSFKSDNSQAANVSAVPPGGGGSPDDIASAGSAAAPSPILQQFGRPSSTACDLAAAADLNWSGVGSGGWSESWAEWVNEGRGGSVCSRMLVYSSALGAWTVS